MIGWIRRHIDELLEIVMRARAVHSRHLAVLWLFGSVALVVVTWACFALGLSAGSVGFAYLIVIVLLSLFDSFISSTIFSLIAIACLDFFFFPPIFTFTIDSSADILTGIAFVATSFIITALVRRLRDLAAAHSDQVQLLNLTHDSIFVRDSNDIIIFWNRGAEELYGWTEKEASGTISYDLLLTKFPAPLEDLKQELLRTGRWEGELIRTKRDATQISVASRWSLQRDANGRPAATLETSHDITERKRAEETLRRTQATYLAEAQRLSRTGSFGWNTVTGDIVWSEESFRIFGFPPTVKPTLEAIMGRVHPDDVAQVEGVIGQALREKQDLDFEHRLLMPDGSVRHLHIVARIVCDEPGTLQFAGAMMDITAVRQAQEQLQQAQAELAYITRVMTLGELTASIAHEVNQPLAAIVTSGDASLRFLARDPPDLDEVRDAVQRMISDGRRASDVVQRIRALTRRSAPRTVAVDLNQVIRDSVVLVRREMASQRVVMQLDLMPELPTVPGDAVQLQQVVINLIINGMQAMASVTDRACELAIRSSRDEAGQVVVSVQDSGAGIDPQHLDRLFDAFFTTKPDGMGMGLAICRTIIETHGGRLWATGNAGPGATFQFSLPAIEPNLP